MRAHRWLPLVMVLVPVCHCGARTSFDEDTTTAPGPTEVTAPDFVEAFPVAFCARYEGCCGRVDHTVPQCLATQRQQVERWATLEGRVFDPTRASACLDSLRSWSENHDLCQLDPVEQFASCWHVFDEEPVARYPGESCEHDARCVGLSSPRCALDVNTGQRHCQVDPYIDAYHVPGPCRTDTPGIHAGVFDCAAIGRVCSVSRDACSYQRDTGETCQQEFDCRDHLRCDQGVCVAALGAGASCDMTKSGYSLCDQGLTCLGQVCVLADRVTLGEACSTGDPPVECDEGTCVAGLCRDVHRRLPYQCGVP